MNLKYLNNLLYYYNMSSVNGLRYCGLNNLGNTCYLNTTLQCLKNLDNFTEYFVNDKYLEDLERNKKESLVTYEFSKLIKELINTNEKTISPKNFVQTFTKFNMRSNSCVKFIFGRQHDMHEFLVYLLDIIHVSLEEEVEVKINGKPKNKYDEMKLQSVKEWATFIENQYSELIELFFGQYIIDTNNNENNVFISRKFESFNNISLELMDVNSKFFSKSLYDSLDYHCKEELLEGDNKYYDEDNDEYVDAKRSLSFWKLPKYLIIHLKRFRNNLRKIDSLIQFPIKDLDMAKYCKNTREKSKYDLISVGNHIGFSSNAGHYFSMNKNKDGKWLIHNDSNVREIEYTDDEDLGKKIITKNAYVLIYEKK